MKRVIILFIFALALSGTHYARVVKPIRLNPGTGRGVPAKPVKLHSDNTLIIFYCGDGGKKSLMKAVKKYGATVLYEYNSMKGIAIKLPQGKKVEDAKAHFEKVKGVLQVNYDKIMRLM